MRTRFFVKRGPTEIYSLDFPTDDPWQFAEFAKEGIADFREKFPDTDLAAPDVSFGFAHRLAQ